MTGMLSTDGYVFLSINDPVCAWAAYRGVLVSPPEQPGFISVWTAKMLKSQEHSHLRREFALERIRAAEFPRRISRLRGMFCFPDIRSAEMACAWSSDPNSHFRAEFLAELNLNEAGSRRDRLDSNWITYATPQSVDDPNWARSYWRGEPFPRMEPVWEILVDGRITILGTELREHAYKAIRRWFPESLLLLEIGRQAGWIGSNLGNTCAYLSRENDDYVLKYLMDMYDAENPRFLKRLTSLRREGHPINWEDMRPHIERGSFGKTPDLRPLGFRRPVAEMPYLA
jgi:hypothetical protein